MVGKITKVPGVLFITNCALRFKDEQAKDTFQLVYNRLKLTGEVKQRQ